MAIPRIPSLLNTGTQLYHIKTRALILTTKLSLLKRCTLKEAQFSRLSFSGCFTLCLTCQQDSNIGGSTSRMYCSCFALHPLSRSLFLHRSSFRSRLVFFLFSLCSPLGFLVGFVLHSLLGLPLFPFPGPTLFLF
jgi:hypothetical protein